MVTYTFTPSTTILSSEVNQNFTDVDTDIAALEAGINWTPIETLSPSTATTITSTGTLPVYDEYLVKFKCTMATGTANELGMRFNGNSGANYGYYNGTTYTTGATSMNVASFVDATYPLIGHLIIRGVSPAVASGKISWVGNQMAYPGSRTWSGDYAAGSAVQLTSITIFRIGGTFTFSGEIKIYGRNI